MLISYIRDDNRVPIGVIVALDKQVFGISICSPRDRFNKAMGIKIAEGRAILQTPTIIPNRVVNGQEVFLIIEDAMVRMHKRAAKYFK